ncbi:serine/threonine protein phosphatase 2A regulatory subunit B beta isoform isoform X1 [Cinnamomum micranthum f. kanehirae]|uniref:Serine/threonine protein phosphatase 2A regulatory subunit B beta isoform isoform X1 n=1 Tax=Cinnamomum micranthum f. kanehirae TaxID=337451 RepID=A0A443PTG8_9MAGN|nr:serine/threonine protein phosphatase 2A regulatory subunit B beta isoform isoform X1 [Cinnamomum micranthum f. kanehirae]
MNIYALSYVICIIVIRFFDKFGCCLSRDGLYFATIFFAYSLALLEVREESHWKLAKIPNRLLQTAPKAVRTLSNFTRGHSRQGHDILNSENAGFPCDLNAKLLHLAWHPTKTLIACAAANSLYMYYV